MSRAPADGYFPRLDVAFSFPVGPKLCQSLEHCEDVLARTSGVREKAACYLEII